MANIPLYHNPGKLNSPESNYGFGGVAEPAASTALVWSGILSAFASNRLTCHISVGERDLLNEGMPVMRIPLDTFQYVWLGGSSVTMSSVVKSCGGTGNMPLAAGGSEASLGSPWQKAQFAT
jgi:hypothetical protein